MIDSEAHSRQEIHLVRMLMLLQSESFQDLGVGCEIIISVSGSGKRRVQFKAVALILSLVVLKVLEINFRSFDIVLQSIGGDHDRFDSYGGFGHDSCPLKLNPLFLLTPLL